MKLPPHPNGGVQIGVSDILAWRDCPRRMLYGMRRHEEGDLPESWSPANAYGSAIHLCIAMLDDSATIEQCLQAAYGQFAKWLEPSDVSRLREDMEKYLAREMLGTRTLLNEGEISVPLFVHPVVGQVWFRARIDRLMQSIDDPAVLVHVDYKSSKHAKSDEEVSKDIQLWAYNWSIDAWFQDLYPEVGVPRIQQWYDQLRYGEIPTRKSVEQRAEIHRWLILAVTDMIEDDEMAPTFNEWCPWCSLKMDCTVIQHQLTAWAQNRIAALMPREERLKKNGEPSKVQGKIVLDHNRLQEYVTLLVDIKRGKQVLEAFEKEVGSVLRELPDSELHAIGKQKRERSARAFDSTAKRAIIEDVGLGTFLLLSDLSLASVERFFADDKAQIEKITSLAQNKPGAVFVTDL